MTSRRCCRKWRYTWESLAHIPTLRLFLFTQEIKPLIQCKNLKISLDFEKSLLVVSWIEEEFENQTDDYIDFSLRVPVPRVLIDLSSPVDFKAMEDHIEVKLVLLLPVDDPLFRNFSSVLDIANEEPNCGTPSFNLPQSLSVDSDLKYLSSQSEVHFFCKNCSAKLTKNPLRSFSEMPSADWREIADNWFGSCCCSFGGISEKLVKHYANSYLFSKSTCLLDASSVVVSNRDLSEQVLPDIFNHIKENDVICDPISANTPLPKDELSANNWDHCCGNKTNGILNHEIVGCTHDSSGTHSKDQEVTKCVEPLKNQNALLNVSLGNGFMVRNSNLTKDVDWIELSCPLCSSILGAYPSTKVVDAPADGGIRLFKCYTSTGLPVGGSDDIFRNYTLHKLFMNRLTEIAHHELSFRTVVRDLATRSPLLQIVLLNSDAWRCTGYCLENENIARNAEKVEMQPIVKVLFSDCSNASKIQSRVLEEWATKNEADEVFMLKNQVMDLIESLNSEMKCLPLSCSTMQGLSLSSIKR